MMTKISLNKKATTTFRVFILLGFNKSLKAGKKSKFNTFVGGEYEYEYDDDT